MLLVLFLKIRNTSPVYQQVYF